MKHFLLTATLLGAMPAMAWNVSSEPAQRNILIEEFTGIHCPNCPDGQRVANELKALHPGRIFSVAIHAGYYAEPSAGEPDYTTNIGNMLGNHFQPTFFPCGIVNRTSVDNNLVQSRGDWGPISRDIVNQTSPVNLWMESSYDCSSRELKVTVEGYMTDDISDPRLNVFLLQSEILGPQAGGQMGGAYPHRHMLRDRVTSEDFGEKLEAKKGEYFSKTYTYAVPEDYWDIPVAPEHLSLLTFVTDGEDNVCQVIEGHPALSQPVEFSKIETTAPLILIGKNYALDFVELYIHNYGNVPVKSADFDVTLNDDTFSSSWSGNIGAYETQLVRVPLDGKWKNSYDNDQNQYSIRMTKANGEAVETNSVRGSFRELYQYPDELKFVIKTDLNAGDNTFRILDEAGTVVKEFGPYPEGEAKEYTESVQLENGKVYGLEVTDAWGDGMRHPLGSIRIYDKYGKSVTQLREIDGYGFRQFFRTDATLGADGIEAEAEVIATEIYDAAGRRVNADIATPGVYVLRQQLSDGTVRVVKKAISR